MKKLYYNYVKYGKVTSFILMILCYFLAPFIESSKPKYIKMIVEASTTSNNSIAIKNSMILIGLVILGMALYYLGNVFRIKSTLSMDKIITDDINDKMLKLKLSDMNETHTEEIQNLIVSDATTVVNVLQSSTKNIIETILYFVLGLVLMYSTSPLVTLVIGIFIPILCAVTIVLWKDFIKVAAERKEAMKKFYQVLGRMAGYKTIKIFSREKIEKRKFNESTNTLDELQKKVFLKKSFMYNIFFLMDTVCSLLVILIGSYQIAKGEITVVDLLYLISMLSYAIKPVNTFTDLFFDVAEGINSNNKILEFLNKEEDEDGKINLESFENSIEFRNVSFSYDSSTTVLKNVNLKIKKGQKVGLFGPSGGGKSTIANLIPRFYRVDDGEILLDGININQFSAKSLRRKIGIVSQDNFLFSSTIKENIKYGNLHCTDEEMIEAAKKANIHDFISSLEEGYDSKVGNNGVKLSGGQKQRIALARVFLMHPQILILDEATSALDNESEEIIKDAIDNIDEETTVISIAHRFSTIENSDILIGICNHGIAERGTKDKLLNNKNSLLSKLYR